MNGEDRTAEGGIRAGEATLWAGAALVVLAAHAGAVLWYLHTPPPTVTPPPAAATLAVTLAPMPAAEDVEDTELPPGEAMVEAPRAPLTEIPAEKPEEVAESDPGPIEDTELERKDVPDEITESDLTIEEPAPEPAVPLPRPRPEPPARPTPSSPPPQASLPAPRSTAPPRADTQAAPQTTAPEAARGEPAPRVSPAQWQQRLLAHLERHKRYPPRARARREQGTTQLRFSIDASGIVTDAAVTRSSGHPDLDQAAIEMIRRASPVPRPPPGVARTLTVPVRFSLR